MLTSIQKMLIAPPLDVHSRIGRKQRLQGKLGSTIREKTQTAKKALALIDHGLGDFGAKH